MNNKLRLNSFTLRIIQFGRIFLLYIYVIYFVKHSTYHKINSNDLLKHDDFAVLLNNNNTFFLIIHFFQIYSFLSLSILM